MRIALTKNMFAVVDSDNSNLGDVKWYAAKNGHGANARHYAIRSGNVRMHRVIMERYLGRPLKRNEYVDHINGDGLDNRIKNLRIADARQNNQNVRHRVGTKSSIYKGVSFNKSCRRWQSYIRVDGKRKHLGLFDCEEDAAAAYDRAAEYSFGEYSHLNFPRSPIHRASKKQLLKVGLL